MPWAAQFPLHLIYCFSSLVFPPPLGFPLLPPSPCLAWLLLAAKIQGDAGILQCPAWSISLPRASSCPRRPARPQNGAVKRIKSKYLSIKHFSLNQMCERELLNVFCIFYLCVCVCVCGRYFWFLLGFFAAKPLSRIYFPLLELQLGFVWASGGFGQPLAISLRHPITPDVNAVSPISLGCPHFFLCNTNS